MQTERVMQPNENHLSDQELLLSADGELAVRDVERVESHLAACWACRARKQEIEATILDFVRVHRGTFDPRISSADGPRALLKAGMAQVAESGAQNPLRRIPWRMAWILTAAACALALLAYFVPRRPISRPGRAIAVTVPDRSLTPGATILLTQGEVCRESSAKNKSVPAAMQRRVFDEYGIRSATPAAYEVDYLITPALGGADDIHNLWPQTTTSVVWNAQVKDALEDHLRDLVCDGQLDLTTAQRELASNWIEAYKKYFHTERPLER
jgi:hypothetical protein